ncbi:ABC transporter permease [Megamonas hypermegale]|uniref:ABC transporter permease n=1 Tax=Megamonas hypermegale TaxID=158847 RepID=A0A921HRF5_9FIRM|nr:ABC transporter permease [Megamonas hypermegale]MDM8143993.1 ABC transporter permease [Megamonas hypermegale]HJF85721.1 ABC transporter permease [Megamonas hypermegale]
MNDVYLRENRGISVHDFLVQSQYAVEPDFEEEIIPRKVIEAHRARMNTYYKIFSLLFFFGLWQLISYLNGLNEWFNPVFLPSPAMVIETAYDYILDGTLIGHIGMSFYRMIVGFVIGVVIAVVLGILIATKRDFDNIFTPILNLVGPIPVFAFLPMFLIWFGIGEASKIALIAYATFVPLITYVIDGIKNTDPILIRSARSLGATPYQVFTKVIFKSAMPHIFAGMKISLALTFSALVVAEMMGASEGLGYIIVNAKNWFKMADMFLAATLIGLEYTIFYGLLTLVEKRLFRWKKVGMSKAVEN